jgi:aminoglycoside 3-N-acetyltransferase
MSLLGEKGTLVVPTHSFSLCNTDVPFSVSETPSETGPFTEFVRTQNGAVRQYHAFSSRVAVGYNAQQICGDCSLHAYGFETPFQRMTDADGLFVSMGMPASSSVSLVHQAEFLMGVPYRYTKEFVHPVIYNGTVVPAIFYLYVTYRDVDIKRDNNRRIFGHFSERYKLHEGRLGLTSIQSFSMREFMNSTTRLMRSDIYSWLSRQPKRRPYRN